MRHATTTRLQWGYPPPTPSAFRTAWVILIATAVGATASASVVVSLVDRSASQTSLSAQPVARLIQASRTRANASQIAQVNPQTSKPGPLAKASTTSSDPESGAAREWSTNRPIELSNVESNDVDAVTDGTQARGTPPTSVTAARWPVPDPPAQVKPSKRHSVTPRYAWRRGVFGLSLGERQHAWGSSGG